MKTWLGDRPQLGADLRLQCATKRIPLQAAALSATFVMEIAMIVLAGLGICFALLGIACVFVGEMRVALGFGLLWLFCVGLARDME